MTSEFGETTVTIVFAQKFFIVKEEKLGTIDI